MHRTRHANCAIRSSAANYANMKQAHSAVQFPNIGGQQVINIGQKSDVTFETNVLITNVHQLISNEKVMSRKKGNKKKRANSSAEIISAPETALTPPSTPSSPLGNNEKYEFLTSSWNQFTTKENGEIDDSIVVYKPKRAVPEDFVAFDIDRFLAEKLLKELDIDPKIANF